MSQSAPNELLNLRCGELAARIQHSLWQQFNLLVIGLVIVLASLWIFDFPNIGALIMILIGSLAPIVAWIRAKQPGLPLVALVGLQTLFVFATPIATQNPTLARYTSAEVFSAGVEVCVFGLGLVIAWQIAMSRHAQNDKSRSYTTLNFIQLDRPAMLSKLGLTLLGSSTLYQLLLSFETIYQIYDSLPQGIGPIIRTVFDGAALAGCLIGSYAVGAGAMKHAQAAGFWALVTILCLLKISSLLLSGAAPVIAGVCLGYVIGAHRLPTAFVVATTLVMGFLNLSKFEMRAKHWNEYGQTTGVNLIDMPDRFAQWLQMSVDVLNHNHTATYEEEQRGQQLTDRLNNLQNLLYAQGAIEHGGCPLLLGDTYTLIPKLLIPRVLWPQKPRTHEGQVILNVHFGRQSLDATFTTYVAWGLLAEAYGNFGSIWGPLLCGLFLGAVAGIVERWIRPYPITSLEAFLFLIIAANFSLSFEMVASVWVTSVFQMIVALILCVLPFARRQPVPKAA